MPRRTYATRSDERSAAWHLSARGRATGRRRARPRAGDGGLVGRLFTQNQALGQPDGLYWDLAGRTRGIFDLKGIGAGLLAGLRKRTGLEPRPPGKNPGLRISLSIRA
jgi:hypothetical protein